jgi:hypothetical protein
VLPLKIDKLHYVDAFCNKSIIYSYASDKVIRMRAGERRGEREEIGERKELYLSFPM